MAQIDMFCADKGQNDLSNLCEGNPDDRAALFEVIDTSAERSSRMAAILFSAIIEQTGVKSSPKRPVCIVVEGTNFTKSVLFRKKLDRYIKEYLEREIVSFEDSTLIGSAYAALL